MPIVLIIIGVLLVVTALQNTYKDLGTLLSGDFTGQGNFFYWLVAIAGVACIGFIPRMQPFSRVFIGLVLVSMFLAKNNRGFWSKLTSALNIGSTASHSTVNTGVNNPAQPVSASSGGSSGSGIFGSLLGTAGMVVGGMYGGPLGAAAGGAAGGAVGGLLGGSGSSSTSASSVGGDIYAADTSTIDAGQGDGGMTLLSPSLDTVITSPYLDSPAPLGESVDYSQASSW